MVMVYLSYGPGDPCIIWTQLFLEAQDIYIYKREHILSRQLECHENRNEQEKIKWAENQTYAADMLLSQKRKKKQLVSPLTCSRKKAQTCLEGEVPSPAFVRSQMAVGPFFHLPQYQTNACKS